MLKKITFFNIKIKKILIRGSKNQVEPRYWESYAEIKSVLDNEWMLFQRFSCKFDTLLPKIFNLRLKLFLKFCSFKGIIITKGKIQKY